MSASRIKPKLSDSEIIAALRAACGQVYLAAEKLGCRPGVIVRRCRRSPQVAAVLESFRGKLVDTAEAALFRAILDGESWAVRFALSTQGQERGYGEREGRDDPAAGSFLSRTPGLTVQQVLHTLIENDDFLDFCRAKHAAAVPQTNPPSEPPAAPETDPK